MEPEISSRSDGGGQRDKPAGQVRRLGSAVRRRAGFAWSCLTRRPRQAPVEAAMAWLLRAGAGEGIPQRTGGTTPSPAVTAACLETVLAYGLCEPAERWARWLASAQPSGGRTDWQSVPQGGESVPEKLDGLAIRPTSNSPRSCPADPGPEMAAPILARDLARLARRWYRLGGREPADRAMRRLERIQGRDGGFPERAGGLRRRTARGRDVWAAKWYLDAALLRVRAAFEARWQDFPDWIDPEDGRVLAVRRWCERLPPAARVADVGCGRGRFLRHLVGWLPQARFLGVDLAPAMLAQLPPGVTGVAGSLLRLPLADATLDGAFAVESLEHALLPERAVAELCRVVRPGGRVLVIDKDRRKQALSEHDPWERWLAPEELTRWLGRWCEEVTVSRVSHTEGRPGRDLFLAGEATRRVQR